MALLDTLKKVAEQSQNANVPAAFLFGNVTATSPLTIRVDNRFDITGEAIVVMKEFRAGYYPTHRHSGFADSPTTQPKGGGSGDPAFASNDHTLKNDYLTNTGPTSEYYYGLAVGDKVVLLRNQGGQSFLVLGRV